MELLPALLETDLASTVDHSKVCKLVECLVSPSLASQLRNSGLDFQSKPPFKLRENLELMSYDDVLIEYKLGNFKVYLMTKLHFYRERQQEGTAYQPKDRVFAFVGDCNHFTGPLGWGFQRTWIPAQQWDPEMKELIETLKQRFKDFATENINAVFITGYHNWKQHSKFLRTSTITTRSDSGSSC